VFFDWLVAAGILGLISYLSLYGVTLWFMWKKENDIPILERAILTGLLAGYFIHNIFVFDNLTSYILFFATLAYITVRANGHKEVSGAHPVFAKDSMNLIVIPFIGIALLVTLYYVNYRPLMTNVLVIKAMSVGQYMQTMPFADAVKMQQDAFTQAIAMNTLGSIEAREQFLQMIPRMAQIQIPEQMSPVDKQSAVNALNGLLMAGRKDVESSYELYKDDVRMLSLYGVFFNGVGDGVSAEKVLKRALELAPNKQLLSYDLVRALLIQQKNAEAYAVGRATYDLGINCNNASKWLLLSAAYNKSYKEAEAYVVSKGQSVSLDPDVLGALVSTGQTNVAIELLQREKSNNPALAPQIDAYIKQLVAPKK
jgi:ABC-type iron transport system FetAB permease component